MDNRGKSSIEEIMSDPYATLRVLESLSSDQKKEWEQRHITEEEQKEWEERRELFNRPISLDKLSPLSSVAQNLGNTGGILLKAFSGTNTYASALKQFTNSLPDVKPIMSDSVSSMSSPDPSLFVSLHDNKLLTQVEIRNCIKEMCELMDHNQRIQEERHKEDQRIQVRIHKDYQKRDQRMFAIVAITLVIATISARSELTDIAEYLLELIRSAIAML